MRMILLPVIAGVAVSATPAPVVPAPAPDAPALSANAPNDCPDRIETVRETLDQPKLDRRLATAERPYLIAAVDKRIDGCAVMQMKGDINDLRPVPAPSPGPARLQPAR